MDKLRRTCAAVVFCSSLACPALANDGAAANFFVPAASSLNTANMQTAGVGKNGYRKPGAPVQMKFLLADDVQPGDKGNITTVWTLEEDTELMNLQIIADSGMELDTPGEIELNAPVTGKDYVLDIGHTALKGAHEVRFISTTRSGNKTRVRTFAIALEVGEIDVPALEPGAILQAPDGEWIHRMETSPR